MSKVADAIQTQIQNIESSYGKSIEHWFAVIRASGRTKHNEVVAMLKIEHGMTHGAAHRVSLLARQAAEAPTSSQDYLAELYSGAKKGLLPIHERLMDVLNEFGSGPVEVAPKRGYVSLRRTKQFAMIKPSTSARVDVGLILKDVPVTARLESAEKFNALFTHRVRLIELSDIDEELIGWLHNAYSRAG